MKNTLATLTKPIQHLRPTWVAVFACLILLLHVKQAPAATLNATSDGQQLWISGVDKSNTTSIYQLDFSATHYKLRKATEFNNLLISNNMTSKNDGAWLLFKNKKVWSITAKPYEPGLPSSFNNQYICQLPEGLNPLSSAGISYDPQSFWMFARIESAKTLKEIDGKSYQKPTSPQATRQFRLLKIQQGKIQRVSLPEKEPNFRSVWLISPTQNQKVPTLIFADALHETLHIYFPIDHKAGWKPYKKFSLKTSQQKLQFTMVQKQLIMASSIGHPIKDKLDIKIWNLRDDLENPMPITTLSLNHNLNEEKSKYIYDYNWRLIPINGKTQSNAGLGVVAFPKNQDSFQLLSSNCYLDGSPMTSFNQVITQNQSQPLSQPGPIVLICVLMFSTLVLYLFWKRDPEWNQLVLPEGYLICDLSRRLIAGLIDLVPCLWLSMGWFNLTGTELYDLWQLEYVQQWDELKPIGTAIGLYIAHCTILEMFTHKSLGKWVMGLKVVGLDGTPPNFWQILSRNGMKSCELIAYYLFLIPVLLPYRQRIGDLVAKTIVVVKVPKEIELDKS